MHHRLCISSRKKIILRKNKRQKRLYGNLYEDDTANSPLSPFGTAPPEGEPRMRCKFDKQCGKSGFLAIILVLYFKPSINTAAPSDCFLSHLGRFLYAQKENAQQGQLQCQACP